jgi:uncharacterized protein (UPF0332 family)
VSPRSRELFEQARERLRAARGALDIDVPGAAVSAGYYAMLYAARAALSEEDQYAKTHRGTWGLFRDAFVTSGRFDRSLHAAAQDVQREREAADYDAKAFPPKRAEEIVAVAEQFVAAVGTLLGR